MSPDARRRAHRSISVLLAGWAIGAWAPVARAQTADEAPPTVSVPDSKIRVRFDLLGAGYWNHSQAPLGHEAQGRVGWAIVGLSGTVNRFISFAAELNPVDDSARPKPACGEPNYFYPNVPDTIGPPVACDPDGRNRVDVYRFIGLDPLTQQSGVRTAVIDVHRSSGAFGVRAGRIFHPLGFAWYELGSWTNEDAPFIQRLNAAASFGVELYAQARRHDDVVLRLEYAQLRADTNRNIEYSYSAFVAADEDTNSGATGMGRVRFTPTRTLDLRVSGKYGFSGSKVESYPSFYLSKRNDFAAVGSVSYRPNEYLRGFGEGARYGSGLPDTSADLLGLPHATVTKSGYYAGAEATIPLPRDWKAIASATYEDLSRNDSLVWYMAHLGRYNVRLGEHVRSTILRWSIRPAPGVELGAYWNHQRNPYPWLSGIVPVSGDRAYDIGEEDRPKYGFVFRVRVP